MKYYITKDVLIKGIQEFEDENYHVETTFSLLCIRTKTRFLLFIGRGVDWHTDYGSALKRAELLRQNAINGLQRRIKKLQRIDFRRAV